MNYFSNLFHYILFLLKASMYFLSPRLYFRCIRYHHSFYFLSLQLYRDKILPIQFSIWQIRIRAHTQVRIYSRHIINYNESNNYQNWKFYLVNNIVNDEDKYNIDVHNIIVITVKVITKYEGKTVWISKPYLSSSFTMLFIIYNQIPDIFSK